MQILPQAALVACELFQRHQHCLGQSLQNSEALCRSQAKICKKLGLCPSDCPELFCAVRWNQGHHHQLPIPE